MITNSKVTIYHKRLNEATRLEKWDRFNYKDVWFFDSQKANIDKGYGNANNVDVRISYSQNEGLDINNFAKGDIIVQGELNLDINTQQDLANYNVYNITSINNNNFGGTPHIHLGGK